ncbi:MAG: glycosyltransferase [Alphaproteobacteria bacterium]|jgi:glycosyltransferase involved in cell wall biosynthesis|nr:glycosyltransferase [Alphaproteobacteria bacterium]
MTVSCILPAWNEAPRIGAVLEVVTAHPLIDEVIVVDDASEDDTVAQVLRFAGLRLIRQPCNRGKSAAVAAGLRAMRGDIVVFLDSDLIGLDASALRALILPVITGQADATISLRGNTPLPWRWLGLDYLSGERAMRKTIAPPADRLDALPRFGMEVMMNDIWLRDAARLHVVAWPKVASPGKSRKLGKLRGLIADAAMIGDILATIGLPHALRQIGGLRRLRLTAPFPGSQRLPFQQTRSKDSTCQHD